MTGDAELLKLRLRQGATRLARCWRITRTDGVSAGFTDHDRDITFDDTVFSADSGMDAQAIERSTGLNVDNSQAMGALRSAAIDERDLLAGRYDGAEVLQWTVDWEMPEARILTFRGTIGEVRQSDGAFEAELRSMAEALNRPVGRAYLKTCDRDLGDGACGVNLGAPEFRAEGQVQRVDGNRWIRWLPATSFEERWFENGVLHWLTGENAGVTVRVGTDVIEADARVTRLWSEPPFPVAEGDGFEILAGCDKSARTCRRKFDNMINFRGFPHMPGEDWVTSYPRSGDRNDGSAVIWSEDCDDL